jgi:Flp pilus assembly protein TadB
MSFFLIFFLNLVLAWIWEVQTPFKQKKSLWAVIGWHWYLLFKKAFVFFFKKKVKQLYLKRFEKSCDQEFPFLLTKLEFSLKSGLTLFQSISSLQSQSELKSFLVMRFFRLKSLVETGVRLEHALKQVAHSFSDQGVSGLVKGLFLSLSLALQKGQNLASVIEDVQNNYRSFKKVEQKIKVNSSNARFQAKVIGASPVVVLILVGLIDFQKLQVFFSLFGFCLLIFSVVMNGIGFFWMYKLMKILDA